jgi:monoamine oxidase
MSRTPLFAAVKKALARSFHDDGLVLPRSSALTRRRLLRLSAAAAGAVVLSPVLDWNAYAKQERPKGPVAIIGGGVAGLTAAYRLQAAGATPIVFEASNRWGGRMFTVYDFYKGMFCELGGEFVDTNHEDLQTLASELGVEMQKLAAEGDGEDLYFFKNQFHTPKEMIDPEKQTGAFAPIAKRIAKDADKLTDKDENWTSHARKLDKMSLKAYLEQFRGKTDDWAIDLLDVGYNIEFGLLTEDQSSLNMVDFITTDMDKPFSMFGESDEVFRIKGGSSALIKALLAALENKIEMKQGYALTALDHKAGKIVLGFDAPGGPASESYDAVILALPFTKLRQVKGLEGLQLGKEKLKCIRELGYGQSAKILQGTTSRVWRTPESGLPAPSNGTISASRIFGSRAATSRAMPVSSPTFWASKPA